MSCRNLNFSYSSPLTQATYKLVPSVVIPAGSLNLEALPIPFVALGEDYGSRFELVIGISSEVLFCNTSQAVSKSETVPPIVKVGTGVEPIQSCLMASKPKGNGNKDFFFAEHKRKILQNF